MNAYQLKISMKGAKPPVWRRVNVPKDLTFNELHETIQRLFGWMDEHLYKFRIASQMLEILGPGVETNYLDDIFAEDHYLYEFLNEGTRFQYIYDFGDWWDHAILVEKEIEMEENYPVLIKWKGDNFAEDSGNVEGYEEIVKRSKDKKDADQKELMQWLKMQHIPFDEYYVKEQLSEIIKAHEDLDKEIEKQLDQSMLALRKTLMKKDIGELSLIEMEKSDMTYYIGFNRMDNDIVLQIYDDETAYLQGVDYVSPQASCNIFANTICVIFNEEELPNLGWNCSDGKSTIKILRTGYFPVDLNNDDALLVIDILQGIEEILSQWKKPLPSYETNECLHVTHNHQDWIISKQQIRLHATRDLVHLDEKEIEQIEREGVHHAGTVLCDVLSAPSPMMMNKAYDVLLLIESDTVNAKVTLPHELLGDMVQINIQILQALAQFFKENGIPDTLKVNSENMRFMLSAFCEDLGIMLLMEPFRTQFETMLLPDIDEKDIEILDTLAHLSGEEFYDFMESMDENELMAFQEFITKYLDSDDLNDIFEDSLALKKDDHGKKKFDA
ncbi:plasmid pRiA4b ORF-3 family protein [Absiella sp. AM54-8XD]|uniref:plasmid pRiA4b ORF-3 family protein n=1 Tax=unclassified Amedibacterium TaxID=3088137 RepID=UPI000E412B97|nr:MULTISPECIES: plasmid pRiA4b ORF-3 family protein [unclassified Absiella]RGC19696.1 plasmid pRiA4b ORF-3 family protein [Absiella sp. AM54-8XD]RGC51423.1 plasmid pRiA4b ORF-3 family protein [Absiella sp. AM29-15]